jgi:hydroxypyruvate isomerase
MKFSISFGSVLQDMDFYDRIPAVAEIGYDAVELNPNAADMERVARLAAENGMRISACCGYHPKEDHLASDRAVERITDSIRRLGAVGVEQLILLTGDQNSRTDNQKLLIIENLKRLRDAAEKNGIRLLIEPLNSIVQNRGYYLNSMQAALEIVRIVDSPFVQTLYDIYHMQIMEGNVLSTLQDNLNRIGHIHLAGVPGRHEPSGGELNMERILSCLAGWNYDRYIGLEYWPETDTYENVRDEFNRLKTACENPVGGTAASGGKQ